MKKILCLTMLLSFAFSAFAQNSSGTAPQKGDWMVSFNFGVGSYIGTDAPAPNNPAYTLSAPTSAWFDKNPILDLEGRWMVSDKWALKLTGGFNFSHNPAYNEVTGTTGTGADIPTYNAVPARDNIQFSVTVGADHYFNSKWDQLHLRIGGEVGYAYGRVSANAEDSEDYMGASVGEAYGLKVAPVVGADYFMNEALFLGFDVRPVAYQYSTYGIRPQAGLGLLSSDSHSFSILAQPMIKLGVKF